MKITKKTQRRIRKAVNFSRTLFAILFGLFLFLTIWSANNESVVVPVVCIGLATICFGISYACEELLFL